MNVKIITHRACQDQMVNGQTGLRPDGATIIPWSSGKPLKLSGMPPALTLFPAHHTSASLSAQSAGAVASRAEALKLEKYSNLASSHFFVPIAIESSGVFDSKTMSFIKDLGKRIARQSGDPKSTAFLLQRLSAAVLLGNAC